MRPICLAAVAALISCAGDQERPGADEPSAPLARITRADTAGPVPAPIEEPTPTAPPPARQASPEARPEPVAEPEPPEPETPAAYTAPPALDTLPPAAVDTGVTQPVPLPARPPDTVGTARPRPAREPGPQVPSTSDVLLAAGTEFHATLQDSIHSRRDSAGRSIEARVMEHVRGLDGRVLVPAGSRVRLTVSRLEPAGSRSATSGTLALQVDGIEVGGRLQEVAAEVLPVPHELRGRGVTGSEAAKVGAGAAAGAVAGRVLGGDTRGAVIGGVVGAAGGAAVAAETADRDVVVKAGTPITFRLTGPVVAARP